jgi:acylphosphatase
VSSKCLHATVTGRVQGVGFRYFVQREAQALGLAGWTRNLEDGRSVEVVAEGDEAVLREFETRLREGPAYASVDDIHVTWSDEVERSDGFEIRW